MKIQEVTSLCSQLAYTYSANRRSPTPFTNLLFTSLNGKTLARLESQNNAGYRRWASTEWWSENYEDLWADGNIGTASTDTLDDKGLQTIIPSAEVTDEKAAAAQKEGENERSKADKTSVVYLTADTTEELMELKEGETYIIGGICDHNRYKVFFIFLVKNLVQN